MAKPQVAIHYKTYDSYMTISWDAVENLWYPLRVTTPLQVLWHGGVLLKHAGVP